MSNKRSMFGLAGIMGVSLLAGCASGGLEENSPYDQVEGNYAGVLPCADCSGIKTRLMIDNENDVSGKFTMKSTYLGKSQGNEPMITKGQVMVLNDAGPNQYPVVYQLTGQDGTTVYNLLPLSNGNLQILSRDYTKIQSNMDLTLKRVD
ncbi:MULTISPECIES: copper resistance protein NlpE N-terminal domain-containing protein [Larsenimonas]|uniref:Copper resistance protein NlpE N-terminal domain-containing protein n=1 Tax=Larsenimonas suaedae TaxID=1851019 RepID=A0ABU1GTD6_9GAMM|nr:MULTISPECIES: copper resistance protein NlpE N-terminal domain-containing protein [Larsenimonas]MCM2971737.1 copper resistance protein NlpE [Larsenimonas suaedae]MCM5703842.1 copper resistance protein NlpE [Larsenimonas salina]MDR5895289.1 copper resistance protein NlpE N-terminal domain-containing protein [Larsenimonas suaedae]